MFAKVEHNKDCQRMQLPEAIVTKYLDYKQNGEKQFVKYNCVYIDYQVQLLTKYAWLDWIYLLKSIDILYMLVGSTTI